MSLSEKNVNDKQNENGAHINLYEECYIVYFDILGFKNLVEESKLKKCKFDLILEFQDYILKIKDDKKITNKKIYFLSDSVFMIYSFAENPISSIIWELANIQAYFISKGFLIRGAITIGQVHHNDNNLFGPAVNEVAMIESKIEKPMLVLSQHFFEHYILNLEKMVFVYCNLTQEIKDFQEYLLQDDNYCWIAHINNQDLMIDREETKNSLRELIDSNINNPDEKVKEKYMWLRKIYFSNT